MKGKFVPNFIILYESRTKALGRYKAVKYQMYNTILRTRTSIMHLTILWTVQKPIVKRLKSPHMESNMHTLYSNSYTISIGSQIPLFIL